MDKTYEALDPDQDEELDTTKEIKQELRKLKPEDLDEEFIEKVLEQYHNSYRAWEHVFAQYNDDQRFANGEQWDAKIAAALTKQGLSVLTYNALPSKIKYIVNNARANTPAIKTNPVSNSANLNTAKVYDGIIKHLQYKYNAKHAYINALSGIVIGGIGAWKVLPCITEDGYDIRIERIIDPTSVVLDPAAIQAQDFSTGKFCFVRNWMAKTEFKRLYPKATSTEPIQGSKSGMFTRESICVLEYWCLNEDTKCWEQYFLSGNEVLECNTLYKGRYNPIIFLTGEEKHIEGDHEYKGIVRDVRDMQIMLNLSKSKTADYIARSTNIQWMATVKQLGDYMPIWQGANTSGVAVLPYNPDTAGAPIRLEPPAPPVGFMQASAEADADIRAAIGIRDPLAEVPTSQSGKAISLQIAQGNIGTFEYMDKLNEAIKLTGTVLVDLIPHYFNYPHIREIMGLDGNISTVPLNQVYLDNEEEVMHDLAEGKYSVTISEGASYESQRDEAKDMLLECSKTYPEFMSLAGDIVFRNMNFEGSQEIAARLQAAIPPNILAASNATNGDKNSQQQVLTANLNQAQAQLQQMQLDMQQQGQQLQALQQQQAAKIAEINARGEVEMHLKQLDFQHEINMKNMDSQAKRDLVKDNTVAKQQELGTQGSIDFALEKSREQHDTTMHVMNAHSDIFHRNMEVDLAQQVQPGAQL
jgi:hypothetical protein